MVIRRIREHVAAHNWFAVTIDFLIVVAGIVIGTQVNNWNQARIERRQGAEYRERLVDDLLSNDEQSQDQKAYWERVRHHALSALATLEKPSVEDGRQFLIDAYQASQILTRPAKRFTYNELISTGRIEQLGDKDLREEVSGYYVALDTYGAIFNFVSPYRENLRQRMPSAAQQAVRTQCAETYYAVSDGTPMARLPDKCSLSLNPAIVAKSVQIVRTSPTMINDLNRLVADLDIKLALVGAINDHSRRLRAELKKAQAQSS